MPNPNLIPGPTGPTGATGPAGATGEAGSGAGPGGEYYLLLRWYPSDGSGRMEPNYNKPYPTFASAQAAWSSRPDPSGTQKAFVAGPFSNAGWLEGESLPW